MINVLWDGKSGRVIDRSTVFFNPFRNVWVFSIRHAYTWSKGTYGFERRRSYVENADMLTASQWKVGEPLHRQLDNYNNGMLCAPHRDE